MHSACCSRLVQFKLQRQVIAVLQGVVEAVEVVEQGRAAARVEHAAGTMDAVAGFA